LHSLRKGSPEPCDDSLSLSRTCFLASLPFLVPIDVFSALGAWYAVDYGRARAAGEAATGPGLIQPQRRVGSMPDLMRSPPRPAPESGPGPGPGPGLAPVAPIRIVSPSAPPRRLESSTAPSTPAGASWGIRQQLLEADAGLHAACSPMVPPPVDVEAVSVGLTLVVPGDNRGGLSPDPKLWRGVLLDTTSSRLGDAWSRAASGSVDYSGLVSPTSTLPDLSAMLMPALSLSSPARPGDASAAPPGAQTTVTLACVEGASPATVDAVAAMGCVPRGHTGGELCEAGLGMDCVFAAPPTVAPPVPKGDEEEVRWGKWGP
jgi:hypothetical protein